MVFTTNEPLSEWGKALHDEDLAAAILDRILERERFVHLDGPAWRTRHLNLEEILPAAAERARISGIRVPDRNPRPHQHATAFEAAACVENVCTGSVMAVVNGN